MSRTPDGTISFGAYVQAAIVAGRTENGIFAARVMWGTLDHVIDELGLVYPDLAGDDAALLSRAFGQTRHIYLRRDDAVAQAVSWLRAEQTNVWFEEAGPRPHRQPEREPLYDGGRIHDVVQVIGDHNAAWREWFASVGVRPHLVRYEDLAADPVGVTRGVLAFLRLEASATREIVVQHRRLADEVNAQWIDRYRAEMATP